MAKSLALILFLIVAPAFAQDRGWKDTEGNPAPNTPSRNSANGVGGWLVVTSDEDWQEKWNTPSETIPKFTEAHTIIVGQRLHILTFIANPMRSADGNANVTCDLSIRKPDGSYSVQKQDLSCLTGALAGHEGTLYLSKLVIGFVGEKSDLPGKWTVRVTVKDLAKPATIPLEASFVLQ